MTTLREQCPWDRQQTHRSLVPYLVEETCEVVEAVEALPGESVAGAGPAAAHLREELGDLLLQVVFHAELASEADDGFDLEDVAARHRRQAGRPAPARVRRRGGAEPTCTGSGSSARRRRRAGRSALDGIPERLSALSRASKIIGRSRSHRVPLDLPTEEVDAGTLGRQIVALVARAQASGIDAEQAVREAVRDLEAEVRSAETPAT